MAKKTTTEAIAEVQFICIRNGDAKKVKSKIIVHRPYLEESHELGDVWCCRLGYCGFMDCEFEREPLQALCLALRVTAPNSKTSVCTAASFFTPVRSMESRGRFTSAAIFPAVGLMKVKSRDRCCNFAMESGNCYHG
jgi:hypothetical protein